MFILLNKKANSGRAALKWNGIERYIYDRFYAADVIETDESSDNYIAEALANGEREFISAGGDGTLNHLINMLAEKSSAEYLKNLRIGAIGLGSSNDFQKPYNEIINSIPVRIDFDNCEASDLGVLEYCDVNNTAHTKYWVINSSIGILADANKYFNHCGLIWDYVKSHFVDGAILYAAIQTILKFKAKTCLISTSETDAGNVQISNIGITKNPNFAGDFSYPVPYRPSNGLFDIHIIEKSNLFGLLITLFRLWGSKDNSKVKIESGESDSFEVSSYSPFAVEFDGEVISTKKAKFFVMKEQINLCR